MDKIEVFFKENSSVAVAFSGGVDSAVLLFLAKKYAKRVKAYFVKSAFQPEFELKDALTLADAFNVKLEIINFDILTDSNITDNTAQRCYYCKKKLFKEICTRAAADGFDVILEGTNASDDIEDRPGFKALSELKVLSPLRECGYTKADIRKIAEDNGIFVYNKPSYACLATRISAGIPITDDLLSLTEKAEAEMRNMGFSDFRIRYNSSFAKIELCHKDMLLFFNHSQKVYNALRKYYDNIYLDLKERNTDG